ncbi:MAG: hypothetical protein ACPL5I_14025 [Thermodesulfobacteriota bacterium]
MKISTDFLSDGRAFLVLVTLMNNEKYVGHPLALPFPLSTWQREMEGLNILVAALPPWGKIYY